MPRRLLLVLAVVAVVGAAALVVVSPWSSDDSGPRAGSTAVDGGARLTISSAPTTYRVTYRVEERDASTTERLTVRRPFESRIETFATDDTEAEPSVVEIAELGRTSRRTADGQRIAVALPPALAAADVRIDAVVDDAVEDGLLVVRERRRVLDRDCQVYRTGQTLRLVELVAPSEDAYADACIDQAGLVLEEVEVRGGEIDRRRIAVRVELEPDVDDADLDAGVRTIPIDQGGGAVRELTPGSRTPSSFLELGPTLPLPRAGRYAVVPPQPDAFTDPLRRNQRVGSLTDVLVDGIDVVVVERGGSLGGVDVLPDSEGEETVALGDLGTGVLVLTSGGPELSIDLDGGRYVRLGGTVTADVLATVARGLREVGGGELVTTGGEW